MNDNFEFEFILNHAMNTFLIKPPMSFHELLEVAQEKFELAKITGFLCEEAEIHISSEVDYFEFLNWAEKSEMKQIEILVKSPENKIKRKKSIRKASISFKPAPSNYRANANDESNINGIHIS